MTRTYQSGDVTVRLDGGLERFVDRLVDRAETASVRAARELAHEVAAEARRKWYGPQGVTKRTGKSGDIRVREHVDLRAGTIRVSIGSTDDRRSKGKPVPLFVRRPGRFAFEKVPVSHKQYWATDANLRANYYAIPGRDPEGTRPPYVWQHSDKASDGKKMIDVYVKRPVRKRVRRAARDLGAVIARGRR